MPNLVGIDNDFISHLTAIRDHKDTFDLIIRFFEALNVSPIMHPLVLRHEKSPVKNFVYDRLFEENVIRVPQFEEILSAKLGISMYEAIIRQIYFGFTGEKYPFDDVFTQWRKGYSLGEVHSAAMCIFLDCDYFLSDDKDAVRHLGGVIKRQTQASVEVLNRRLCTDRIKDSEIITGKERRLLRYERT